MATRYKCVADGGPCILFRGGLECCSAPPKGYCSSYPITSKGSGHCGPTKSLSNDFSFAFICKDECIADGATCDDFQTGNRKCCSNNCIQRISVPKIGYCESKSSISSSNAISSPNRYIKIGEICKSDGSIGLCCSGFCFESLKQRVGTGTCQFKNLVSQTPSVNMMSKTTTERSNGTILPTTSIKPNTTSTGLSLTGIAIGSGVLILITLFILLIFLLRRPRRSSASKVDVDRFLFGAGENSDQELPTYQKVDQLPYDASFEVHPKWFNIDHRSVIGSGEFGVVKRGTLKFIPNGDPIQVAVKSTEDGADAKYLTALLSEIKLMIYLKKHENIVTILGACTSDLEKGRAYLFLEFCALKSLESYLRRRKHEFMEEETNRSSTSEYLSLKISSTAENPIRLQDLYNWSHQIAKGLEFLSSKNVVHADLAARNVLLYNHDLAKISDFGLSRRMYNYSMYVKKQQEPLPWKWMAIESLQESKFSTASDVWAFGVTLWEIFSLGNSPYPGLSWTFDFLEKLIGGMRLPAPPHASEKLYALLLCCWDAAPHVRPSPSSIVSQLKEMNQSKMFKKREKETIIIPKSFKS